MSVEPARDTIFALSSGAPPAAIAIVRVSGPAAREALRSVCGRIPEARQASLRTLRGPARQLIDRAITLWFPGPDTATGEDLAELHLHGGRAVVAAALAVLGTIPGCRAAVAGEFTRRAFENGRIDLLQAEGLADLLSAETEGARLRALRLAEGGLSRLIGQWRERLVVLSARVEAILEFGGDDPDIAADPTIAGDIAGLADDLERSLSSAPAERLRDGIRIVLAGPPNSGKSTLINALAGRQVAIATPIAGTTRDLIEAPVVISGIAMVLIDSAGLRDTDDAIERIGIAGTHRAIEGADIIVWLGKPKDRPVASCVLCVRTKDDLFGDKPLPGGYDLAVSAIVGQGLAALQHELNRLAAKLVPAVDFNMTASQMEHVRRALSQMRMPPDELDEVIVAERLRAAASALDELTGRYAVEPMLDALFGRFCIGK